MDYGMRKKIVIVVVTLLLLGASFVAGIYYGYENRPGAERVLNVLGQAPPPSYGDVDFNLFWNVWSQLEEKFVDKSKLEDRQNLVFGAIAGLVKAVGDPHTEFFPPEETKQFQEDISGAFGGIGAEIGIRRGILTIIAPLKGTQAEQAGLKAGDQIFKVDDTITADLTLNEAVQIIRGPEGTKVRLTILRNSFDSAKDFTVVRAIIKIPVLTTAKLENGIFVIKLHHFTQNAGFEFRKAVQEFYQTNSSKLIFDLRNNPGGFLIVSVDIASWFLPAGEVVARERFADGKEEVYRSVGYRMLENIPMVVLVNEGSASASEIVAGALRDLKGSKLIGAKTFGKGSVQELVNLEKKSSLKVTIAKWITPNGTILEGNGLEPDVAVDVPEERPNGEEEKDYILEKGIEVLRGL